MRVRELRTDRVVCEKIENSDGTLSLSLAELKNLDAMAAAVSSTEWGFVDGVTAGTVAASKAVIVDTNKDVSAFRTVGVVNLDAGSSGVAGTVDVFPTTASKGKLALSCTDQTGDTTVSLVAGAMAAARTVTLRDPGAAASFLTTTDATAAATTATAEEITAACDVSSQVAAAASAPVVAAAESIQTSVVRQGDIIRTTIAIDLTGLKSTTTANDIIGDTGVSYIAALTTAANGVIYRGTMNCGEVPATGDPDIDISAATAATGAYDADVTALAGYVSLKQSGGNLAVGTEMNFTALPAGTMYLYLSVGSAGGVPGTYTAGRVLIELVGTVA